MRDRIILIAALLLAAPVAGEPLAQPLLITNLTVGLTTYPGTDLIDATFVVDDITEWGPFSPYGDCLIHQAAVDNCTHIASMSGHFLTDFDWTGVVGPLNWDVTWEASEGAEVLFTVIFDDHTAAQPGFSVARPPQYVVVNEDGDSALSSAQMLSDASFVYSPSDWSALTGTVPFYADAGLCGGVVQATFEVTFNDSELVPLPEPALSTMLGASIALLGIVGRKRCQSR